MSHLLTQVLLSVLFPIVAALAGGIIAMYRNPGPKLGGAIQHFAAGVVFAALATEILPDMHEQAPVPVIVGFAVGVATMLAVRHFTESSANEGRKDAGEPMSLVAAVDGDLLVDGLLIGIGFAVGARQGVLLTVGLTLEILFLGLSTTAALQRRAASRRRVMLVLGSMALALLIGATFGATVLAGLTGFPFAAVVAFGAAALLFLITEELLVEAHEVPETPVATSMFFLGFMLLFVVGMVV